MGGSGEGNKGSYPPPLKNGKTLYISFRNTDTDSPRVAIGPLRSNRFSRESVQPSVKYVDDSKKFLSIP